VPKFFTLLQIKNEIKDELDLEAEDFIDNTEIVSYINKGVKAAEAQIHKLGLEDDYFLKRAFLPMVVGGDEIELPSDIYANKLRGITYDDGSLIYEIKRVRGVHLFNKISNAQHFSNSDDYYQYILINEVAGAGAKILMVPDSRILSTLTGLDGLPLVRAWYIRQANTLAVDADVCDIPEFYEFIVRYAKWLVLYKESHPNMEIAKKELVEERNIMIDTLANMVPDRDSEIVPDLDQYTDIS